MVADFLKKQKREKEDEGLLLKTLSVIFIGLAIFLIISNVRLYQRKQALIKEVENYTLQIKKIEESNGKLKEEIANSDNQDYIEKVAREEINMQKPGEKAVSFILPEEKSKTEENTNILSSNFWTAGFVRFWQGVKNIFK